MYETHWRNTGRRLRFLGMDARVVYVFLPALLHLRLWTLCLAALCMAGFWIIAQFGVAPRVALSNLYLWCATAAWRWNVIDTHRPLHQRRV
ncbi:MAG: IcmT/TraK family protein [Candidatus Eutrophobiaceae bacterium]